MGRLTDRIADIAALTGSLGLLVAVAVVMIDVFGRLIGVTLVRGAIDIVGIAMVLAGSFAVAKSVRADLNIRIEPLTTWLPGPIKSLLDRFWFAVSAVLFGFMALRSLQEGLISHGYGEVLTSLGVSVIVFGILVCAGFGLGALAAASMANAKHRR